MLQARFISSLSLSLSLSLSQHRSTLHTQVLIFIIRVKKIRPIRYLGSIQMEMSFWRFQIWFGAAAWRQKMFELKWLNAWVMNVVPDISGIVWILDVYADEQEEGWSSRRRRRGGGGRVGRKRGWGAGGGGTEAGEAGVEPGAEAGAGEEDVSVSSDFMTCKINVYYYYYFIILFFWAPSTTFLGALNIESGYNSGWQMAAC